MRVAGYVRVSTEKQASEGLGLQVQEKAIRAWCKENRHRLVKICADNGVSGTLGEAERLGLAEALNLIAAGKADGLVTYTLDRLARRLHVQEAVLAKAWAAGGRVFTVEAGEIQQDDADDPMRTFVRQVMGAVAELDRAQITRRLRNGRKAKGESGGYAYGSPPYGFKAEGGQLVEVKSEQLVLAQMRELHGEGKSLRAIGQALEAEGHKPRRGEHWSPAALRKILGRQ